MPSAFLGLGIACLFLWPTASSPATIETMVMPGPVIEGHADLEQECRNCHAMFEKGIQNRLCRDCHEKVDADINRGQGFHGRIKDVSKIKCSHCHEDHLGRDADIVRLDMDTFNHSATDFALKGAHEAVACSACHSTDAKFREAPSQCITCHEEDDAHKGRLGRECGDCHSESSWQEGKFDHDDTKFPLEGKHEEVACNQCHPNERYENTPLECFTCHKLNDVHGGRYGGRCETCHSPTGWKDMIFDHDHDTDFPLAGKHKTTRCEACHSGDFKEDTRGTACFDCHEKDDQHRGRNGAKCGECHSPKGWLLLGFDHDKDTDFPLRGKHDTLSCESCHKGLVFEEELEAACYACHRVDDSHEGGLGRDCGECHSETGWDELTFDHGKDTKFPLRGAHEEATCQACHTAREKRDELAMDCYSCHERDDVHQGQEGEQCDRCHNEHSWRERVFFDHDLTRFPLIGLHAVTSCEECHLTTAYKDTSSECAECHEAVDVHEGRLGDGCALCHNPNGWALWRFDHNTQTDYILDGAHEGLECHACHTKRVRKKIELSSNCFACHWQDDIHEGNFGRNCERCHDTESFKGAKVQ